MGALQFQLHEFSQPQIIGCFSIDRTSSYLPKATSCRYITRKLVDRASRLDLNEGYENFIREPEKMDDHWLRYITENLGSLANKDSHEKDKKFLSTDFVCSRGLLRLLMCTPYDYRKWTVFATKYKGTIYLRIRQSVEDKSKTENEKTSENLLIQYYGFKFEQIMKSGELILFNN